MDQIQSVEFISSIFEESKFSLLTDLLDFKETSTYTGKDVMGLVSVLKLALQQKYINSRANLFNPKPVQSASSDTDSMKSNEELPSNEIPNQSLLFPCENESSSSNSMHENAAMIEQIRAANKRSMKKSGPIKDNPVSRKRLRRLISHNQLAQSTCQAKAGQMKRHQHNKDKQSHTSQGEPDSVDSNEHDLNLENLEQEEELDEIQQRKVLDEEIQILPSPVNNIEVYQLDSSDESEDDSVQIIPYQPNDQCIRAQFNVIELSSDEDD